MSAANWGIFWGGGGLNIFFSGSKRPPRKVGQSMISDWGEVSFDLHVGPTFRKTQEGCVSVSEEKIQERSRRRADFPAAIFLRKMPKPWHG